MIGTAPFEPIDVRLSTLLGLFLDGGVPTSISASPEKLAVVLRPQRAPSGSTFDDALLLELPDRRAQPLESHLELTAQPLLRSGLSLSPEDFDDVLLQLTEVAGPGRRTDDLEVRRRTAISAQHELDRLGRRRVSLLGDQLQSSAPAPQVEIALAPGVEVTRPAQTQAHLIASRTGLPRVMDNEDRHVTLALKLAQVGEHAGDFQGGVLVSCDALRYVTQATNGIEGQS